MSKIGIIGSGAWGTALAQVFAKQDCDVLLWAREEEVAQTIRKEQENKLYLPQIKLDEKIVVTTDLEAAVDCDSVLIVTPAQYVRSIFKDIKPFLATSTPVVICAKGIEIESGLMLTQVAAEVLPENPVGVMSGPTFARELAAGQPSAVTLGIKDKEIGQGLIENLSGRTLRIYASEDVIGVQIGGAVKNIIAIACGVAHGLELGESTRAALMTRGLAEMSRLVAAMDGDRYTLQGMCGIGDLVLTCNSMQSRNFSLGAALGRGDTIEDILAGRKGKCVTEGYHTAKALRHLAHAHAVDMPISMEVYECLHEGKPVRQALDDLMNRPLKSGFL